MYVRGRSIFNGQFVIPGHLMGNNGHLVFFTINLFICLSFSFSLSLGIHQSHFDEEKKEPKSLDDDTVMIRIETTKKNIDLKMCEKEK